MCLHLYLNLYLHLHLRLHFHLHLHLRCNLVSCRTAAGLAKHLRDFCGKEVPRWGPLVTSSPYPEHSLSYDNCA